MNLPDDQLDTLKEVINIGTGRAAAVLSEMLEERIVLSVPDLKVCTADQVGKLPEVDLDETISLVGLSFDGSFSGGASLFFPSPSAATLVCLLTGEDDDAPDLDSLRSGTLSEVGNIVLNGVVGSISNLLTAPVTYGVPEYREASLGDLLRSNEAQTSTVLLARAQFGVEEHDIEGEILLLFELGSFDALLLAIDTLTATSEA